MKIEINLNPNSKFKGVDASALIQSCGILPVWALNIMYLDVPLKEAMEKQYAYGPLHEMKGSIKEDGTYVSPYEEDEDLDPVLKIIRGEEIFYQYPYAIVAFVQKDGSSYITRMD